MRILGIIAEYNPFHLGHKYHLQTAKNLCQADAVIGIMSSSFLQRGEPAIANKWARCNMALAAGIDLVLELPTAFSCRSAYWFALGGVKSLAATGIVTHLGFGAESKDLSKLKVIAEYLNQENKAFKTYLDSFLNNGYSYPKARSLTLQKILGQEAENFIEELNNPNNILALAYLRILTLIDRNIEPVLIKRIGNYHAELPEEGFASATAIRKLIKEKNKLWENYVPTTTKKILKEQFVQGKGPIYFESIEQSIIATIRRMNSQDIRNIIEIEEGLENRVWEASQKSGDITSLINELKTKRYTHTRLQRLLTHIFLNFTKDFSFSNPYYLRVLGFNAQGQKLLKIMKKQATLPIITKFAQEYPKFSYPGNKMLELEIRATDLYTLAYPNSKIRQGRQDFYQSPIISD